MPLIMIQGDITKMKVDAIANAAKPSLLGGGGVDGCIHQAAGPQLLAECQALGGCATGSAKITSAYSLPCKYIVHTVGPIWKGGTNGEHEKLASCYLTSLALMEEKGCKTVAFPLISAGAYGYPKEQAIRIAVDSIQEFLREHEMTVYLTLFDEGSFRMGKKLFADL